MTMKQFWLVVLAKVLGWLVLLGAALALLTAVPVQAQTQTQTQTQTPAAAAQPDGTALRARHDSLKTALAASPFQRPLLLESSGSANEPQGRVYGVVAHPFAQVAAALQQGDDWCEMMLLQSNVKRCSASGAPPQQQLRVAIGRRFDQPAADAFQVDFQHAVRVARPDYLSLLLQAHSGPLGTRDYKLTLEAVPVGPQATFIHLGYSYSAGLAARLATGAYLATAGRNKVGFSVVGRDEAGRPRYVDGMRGVVERNTMRYFLAIEALLDTMALPPEQRADARLQAWFKATERYPLQLHEMDRSEYLAMKRREVSVQ